MLFAILAFHLWAGARAAPVTVDVQSTASSDIDTDSGRTTLDIIWSCLATILSCAWVSIHPNVPPPGSHRYAATANRIIMLMIVLFAPEFVVMVAYGEWASARKLVKEHSNVPGHSESTFLRPNQNLKRTDASMS